VHVLWGVKFFRSRIQNEVHQKQASEEHKEISRFIFSVLWSYDWN